MLEFYVISNFLYDSTCWIFFSQMKQKLETIDMYFYESKLRILWTEHIDNENVFRQSEKNKLILKLYLKAGERWNLLGT